LENLEYQWEIMDGGGQLQGNHTESVTFFAPSEPCLTTLRVIVRQHDLECRDEALITVTDSLLDQSSKDAGLRKGLPGIHTAGHRVKCGAHVMMWTKMSSSSITDIGTLFMPASRNAESSAIFVAYFAKSWFVTISLECKWMKFLSA